MAIQMPITTIDADQYHIYRLHCLVSTIGLRYSCMRLGILNQYISIYILPSNQIGLQIDVHVYEGGCYDGHIVFKFSNGYSNRVQEQEYNNVDDGQEESPNESEIDDFDI